MGRRYITAGSVIIDGIILYGEDEVSGIRIGGGGIYASSGIRIFEDGVAFAGYSGQDFEQYYGGWARSSGIDCSGVVKKFPHTRLVDLVYNQEGTFSTRDHFPEYRIPLADMVDAALLRPLVDGSTRGVHILARPVPENLAEIYSLAREKGVRLGTELEVLGLAGRSDNRELLFELCRYLDFFSINLYEAKLMFPGLRDSKDALELLLEFQKPCFFRMGTDGAYLLADGRAYYSPMLDDFGTKDPTGCGNSSTAAAFWALNEGYGPLEASFIGAITASLNASYEGLITEYGPAVRQRCLELAKQQLEKQQNQGGQI